jgi:hypothetical protein
MDKDSEKSAPTILDKFEQFSKIFATVLVPLVLAIGGWIIQTTVEHDKQQAAIIQADRQSALERDRTEQQRTIDQQRVSLEYVKIAKEILTNSKEVPVELARWSWQLLNDVAPTKFDPEDLKKLIERNDRIPAPAASPVALTAGPIDLNGFVIFVNRTRIERRDGKSFSRTVGSYYVTYQGEKLPDLGGATVEREGPGDNSMSGVLNHRRLEAGIYPLFTHAGAGNKYRTFGFAEPGSLQVPPWPALRLENTGNRSGILLHPAAGYLTNVGTINLSKPLAGPVDDIDFEDSRARVISVIQAMKDKLGNGFPSSNNQLIQNAWIVIADESQDSAAK